MRFLMWPVTRHIPIYGTVNNLLCYLTIVVSSADFWESRNAANCFSKEAVRDTEDIRFVNDGHLLSIIRRWEVSNVRQPVVLQLTFRGRAKAISNAILPIRLDAFSVMRRVARASRPFSVLDRYSCLTY